MLVQGAPCLMATVDLALKITFLNQAIVGVPQDHVGKSILDYLAPEHRERVRAVYEGVIATGQPASYEVPYAPTPGREIWYLTNVGPLRNGEALVGAMFVSFDVTASKQAAVEMAKHTAELRQARELDQLKSAFVDAVSHELRSPLTSIKGYAEFLDEGVDGPPTEMQRDFIAHIQRGAARMEAILDDLLEFGRLDAGSFKLRSEPIDLRPLLDELAASFRPLIEAADITLTMALDDRKLCVVADPQRIGQVVSNLLHNAIKFTPVGGEIHMTARLARGALHCEVKDTGPGIDATDIPRLFKRFSQLGRGEQKGGTGLGLSIAKVLVEAHGGTIGVASEPGEGSRFWFRLPMNSREGT